ncbi:MAG: hypothetical protein KC413_23255 [Anaerolineales bacterium]|nr:hypothetical protein [Anaerolineales bacterium]MCA9978704.1 hypothetical protein [Anaerolineales bacterium]
MPDNPIQSRKITISEDDIESRAQRLGLAPARNETARTVTQAEQSLTRFDMERVLALIDTTNNPDELNRIGKAAAAKLRKIGAAQPRKAKPGKKQRRLTDRALLRLYLEITPFLLSLGLVTPLLVWGGLRLVRSYWFVQFVGQTLARELTKACPPTCTWHNLALWAVLGGISLLFAVLASYSLRKRLLRASS